MAQTESLLRNLRRRLLHLFLRAMSPRRRRIMAWWLIHDTDIRFLTFARDGLVWNLRPHDIIGWQLFIDGGFQTDDLRALLAWMRRAGLPSASRNVVIDAGANIGTTCIPLVLECGCRALAIEPVADNFLLLNKNVESNGLSQRILTANKAVSQTPGNLRMCLTDGNRGGHFVSRGDRDNNSDYPVAGHEEVAGDTLAAIVADAGFALNEIALVWADVQGCELEVIESGTPLWQRGVPLWAEIEPKSLRRQGAFETFPAVAARYFARFISANDLKTLGENAPARPIAELPGFIAQIPDERMNADVLFLPLTEESNAR